MQPTGASSHALKGASRKLNVGTLSFYRVWNEGTLNEATRILSKELQLAFDAPGGMSEYRKSLVISFFFKFYLTVTQLLSPHSLPEHLYSATKPFHRLTTTFYIV